MASPCSGSSSIYETEPVGLILDQPEFLNACLEIETAFEPEELLDACKAVEHDVGRVAGGPRHGPRVIDVDVLLLGDLRHSSAAPDAPPPRGRSRRFVLVPLLELAPISSLAPGERAADSLAALPRGSPYARRRARRCV